MWYFRALACDLDGTLAEHDVVAPEVLDALTTARGDRAVILVTGRTRNSLDRVFPGLASYFDAVVCENGAVMYTDAGMRSLNESVDVSLATALAGKGVDFERGEVVLAIDGRDAMLAADIIAELGLDHQIVHNRGAAMILPAGVTKGTGLVAALSELDLSVHNAIAVGDAENDLTLLHTAEIGVAVQNAVPSLTRHADLVLNRPDGAGVVSLITGDVMTGRRRLWPQRRWITIGALDDGGPARLPGSQSCILVTGETASGKSYLAGLLAERWIDHGYSVLVIDPEGDHLGLAERPGVHVVNAASHLPPPHELLALLRPGHASLVLDLSGLPYDEQVAYLGQLPEAISASRTQFGRPHWVIYDEAHQQTWLDAFAAASDAISGPGTCLVTWRPDLLPDSVGDSVDFRITVGGPVGDGPHAPAATAILSTAGSTRSFTVGIRHSAHVRHRHKYTSMPLPTHRRFYFHSARPDADIMSAASIEEFEQYLRHCDPAVLEYHLSRGDFSRWISQTLADHVLGNEITHVERDLADIHAASVERARQAIIRAIGGRYLGP